MAETNDSEREDLSCPENENDEIGDENHGLSSKYVPLPGGDDQIRHRRDLHGPPLISQTDGTSEETAKPINLRDRKDRIWNCLKNERKTATLNEWKIFTGIVMFLLVASLSYFLDLKYFSSTVEPKISWDQQAVELKQIHRNLQKMFPNDSQLWPTFLIGLNNSYYSTMEHPLIMLFLHSKDQKGTADCLASSMMKISKRYLGRDFPISLRGSELPVATGDYFMDWQHNLEKNRVMIIRELEQMPAGVAKYLHSFCDVINPAVQQAIYLFFMEVPKSNDSPFILAENLMLDVWNSLEQYELRPLVTRLLENVLTIRSPPPANCPDI